MALRGRLRGFPNAGSWVMGAVVGAWRSLVAHLFWVQGVVSSNLAAPTIPVASRARPFPLPVRIAPFPFYGSWPGMGS